MLNPEKIKIIKVTTRSSLENQLLRMLQDHSEIEFIDVEKKGINLSSRTAESDTDNEIHKLYNEITSIIEFLQIKPIFSNNQKINLDYQELSTTVQHCKKIFEELFPEYKLFASHLIENLKKISELQTLIEICNILIPLDIKFDILGERTYFNIVAGTIGTDKIKRLEWNLRELTDESIIFHTSKDEVEKGISAIVLGALHKYTDDINRILSSFGFIELVFPFQLKGDPNKIKQSHLQEIVFLEEENKTWDLKKQDFINRFSFELLAVKEQLAIENAKIDIRKMLKTDKYILQFWGYIPQSKIKSTKSLILSIDPDAIIEIEQNAFDDEDVPTKLSNHKYFGKPYEEMVTLYGVPDYKHDYDPSLLISITFPIFFGIMFADIFQGLLLIIIGIFAMKIHLLQEPPVVMIDVAKNYLRKGSFVIIISGIASVIFGIFFWSFAGFHGNEAPSFMQPGGLLYPLHFLAQFSDTNLETYSKYANANGQLLFLELSIVIGIAHISLALFLLFINKIRHGEFKEAFFFPGMLLLAYLSASLLLFSWGMNFVSWFNLSESPQDYPSKGYFNAAILTPIIGYNNSIPIPKILSVIMVGAIVLFILYEMKAMGSVDGISLAADFSISLLGNTVSYTRLFAINIVHSILATIVYLIAGPKLIPPVLPFDSITVEGTTYQAANFGELFLIVIAFLIGTLIIITFELMVTFLQSLRLHIVEFFSKLHFSGTGRAFSPFISRRMYTNPVKLPSTA